MGQIILSHIFPILWYNNITKKININTNNKLDADADYNIADLWHNLHQHKVNSNAIEIDKELANKFKEKILISNNIDIYKLAFFKFTNEVEYNCKRECFGCYVFNAPKISNSYDNSIGRDLPTGTQFCNYLANDMQTEFDYYNTVSNLIEKHITFPMKCNYIADENIFKNQLRNQQSILQTYIEKIIDKGYNINNVSIDVIEY